MADLSGLFGFVLVLLVAVVGPRLSGYDRAQRRRLGGGREVARFRRAWWTGKVPARADRELWSAELEHYPDEVREQRRERYLRIAFGAFLAAFLVLNLVLTRGDLRLLAASVLPVVLVLTLVWILSRLTRDSEEDRARRTARFRAALEQRPSGGGAA